MALLLDGSVHAVGSGASLAVGTLTTSSGNVVVLVAIQLNGTPVDSVTDTGGHTWQRRTTAGADPFIIELWWTTSVAAFNNAITVSLGAGDSSFLTATAWGISGADTSTPFDTNGALPNTGTSGARSITTSNANDFLIHCARLNTGNGTPATGWTEIQDNTDFCLVQYKIVSATQSALSVDTGGETNNGSIADAIQQAGAPVDNLTPQIWM
ncbi:hypothetical protein IVA87_08710 [Bradyrhizobium sp. 147]|uniref:hypothetical protein n=1 Tax=Bradyrhizobium sp. 147 TaxID=2782623 RepID=UPI001FFB0F7C|nr:hypothetical protein [Bradyrhizobium sp. 147]MCK1679540.1 hypothetical protein [Bradyrhizobium sp. 147]